MNIDTHKFAVLFFKKNVRISLREKCPNTNFFWYVFSCIQSEYREILTKKNPVFGDFSHSDLGNEVCSFLGRDKMTPLILQS